MGSSETTAVVMEGSDAQHMLAIALAALAMFAVGCGFALRAFVLGPTHVRRWTTASTVLLGIPSVAVSATAFALLL